MKKLDLEKQVKLLEAMLDGSRVATIVTDPSQEDNPVIFTNNTFEQMTGYPREEVIGRNCRFLQGQDTARDAKEKIRKAIDQQEETIVTLKNYRKDGSEFWNRLFIKPVKIDGELYFIGTQTDISLERAQFEELQASQAEIEELMLPILSIQDKIATVALVGTMSFQRFELLKVKVCEYVQENRIENVLIDITGLSWEDSVPLLGFVQIRDALKIMGSELYITGISPKAAIELVTQENRSEKLNTFPTIQKALETVGKK